MASTQTTAIPGSRSLRCVLQCFSNFSQIGFRGLVSYASVAPHMAACPNRHIITNMLPTANAPDHHVEDALLAGHILAS